MNAIDAGITINSGAVITANTISLSANSSTTATFTTNGSSDLLDSAAITTSNSATIDIYGTLDATGSLSVLTNVTVDDQVSATDGASLVDVVINATNKSTVTLESTAQLSGSSIDIEATTDVDPPATVNGPTPVMILADDLADSYLDPTNVDNGPTNGNSDNATTLAGHPIGTLVGLAVTIANTTEVVIASGAQVDAGSGEVGSTGDSLVINAADQTNVITEFQPASTVYLPLINGVVIFSAIDSTISLDRTTDVLIGDTNSTAANPTLAAGLDTHDTASTPSLSANNTLQATGDAAVTASSGGSIMNEETSDPAQGSAVGSTETTAGSSSASPGDTTIVELRGINVNVGGLAASATSATDYLSESHYVTNTVFGATDGLIDHSNVTAGVGGLSLISTDNSTLTAIADSFDINSEHLTGGIDQFTLTVSATDALNSLDKDVSAQLVNSIHVTSGGTVTIEAVDNETIVATADTETVTITTTPLDKGYFEFGGTFAANAILGQVISLRSRA